MVTFSKKHLAMGSKQLSLIPVGPVGMPGLHQSTLTEHRGVSKCTDEKLIQWPGGSGKPADGLISARTRVLERIYRVASQHARLWIYFDFVIWTVLLFQ